MSQSLKRTFHGCLTCRKRKVRCRGGSPCENCARMNITCHSSFETNLRVSVASPSGGQTDFSSAAPRQARPKPSSQPRPEQSQFQIIPQILGPPPATSAPPAASGATAPPLASPDERFGQSAAEQANLFNGFPSSLPPYEPPAPSWDIDQLLLPDTTSPSLMSHFGLGEGWDFDFTFQSYAPSFPLPEPPQNPNLDPALEHLSLFESNGFSTSGGGTTSKGSKNPATRPCFQAPPRPTATEEWTPRRKKVRRPKADEGNSGQEACAQTRPGCYAASTPSTRLEAATGTSAEEDAFYLKYYGETVQDALAGKPNGDWCYHRYIHRHIQDVPSSNALRLAVLAWTARQYASVSGPSSAANATSQAYYQQADLELSKLHALGDWSTILPCIGNDLTTAGPIRTVGDVTILASLFMCRFDTLNNDLAALAAHLRDLRRDFQRQISDTGISAFASRVLIWLATLDVRIRIFAPAPTQRAPTPGFGLDNAMDSTGDDTTKEGTLMDILHNRDDGPLIVQRSHTYLSEIFGSAYPAAQRAEDAADIPISTRLYEIFLVLSAMVQYRASSPPVPSANPSPSQSPSSSSSSNTSAVSDLRRAKARAIDADLARLEAQFDVAKLTIPAARVLGFDLECLSASAPATPATTTSNASSPMPAAPSPASTTTASYALTNSEFSWFTAYAAYLATKALWSRQKHASRRTDSTSSNAVRKIICIARRMKKSCAGLPAAEKDAATGGEDEGTGSRKAPVVPPAVAQSMLWRLPIFVAGIETTDDVYADWIRAYLKEMEPGKAGVKGVGGADGKGPDADGNVCVDGTERKGPRRMMILDLMERVRELQDVKGRRVDVGTVLAEMEREKGASEGFVGRGGMGWL